MAIATARLNPWIRRMLIYVTLGVVVTASSIALALIVTPASSVSAAGQTVSVGATAPSLSFSGPGELDLFGQKLSTTLQFNGPVRPRLVLTHITIDSQLTSLFGGQSFDAFTHSLGQALASGWTRYFISESLVTAGFALLLIGALAGWWRVPWRRMLLLLGAGLVLVEMINLGAVMLAAYGAPERLSHVGSLAGLVGRAPLSLAAPASRPATSKVDAVVMGDSTAAGLGNAPLSTPSALDRACSRSADSFAQDLAAVNGWNVLNLACSGATIDSGILGPQQVGSLTAPAQLSVAETAKSASVIIVSIGANDVGWSDLLRACAIAPTCDNAAFTAYFQQQLAAFTTSYLQLLQQLSLLPQHPRVVINLYYNPFDAAQGCLEKVGISDAKERTIVAQLNALNSVLAQGAAASSFTSVQPSFAGHALCDAQPYVQGVDASAPFHPTSSGELAIALADEQALLSLPKPSGSHQGNHSGP